MSPPLHSLQEMSLSMIRHMLPIQEGVANRKRPQTTWRRTSLLCTIRTLQETNKFSNILSYDGNITCFLIKSFIRLTLPITFQGY